MHQVCEALVPVLVGVVVDRAIVPGDARALALWITLLALVFTALSLAWRLGMRATVRVYSYGAHALRQLVVRRVLDPRGLRTQRAPGEVLAVASSDTSRVAGVAWLVTSNLAATAAIVTTAVSLLVISVPLGLAVLVATPLVAAAMHYLSVPLETRSEHEQAAAARAGALATDFVTGLRVLKALGAEQAAGRRYRRASRTSLAAALRAARAKAGYSALSSALAAAFLAGVAVAAAWMALSGPITIGELVAVVGLAQFVQGPMATLGFLGVDLAQKRASTVRVRRLLADEPVFPAAEPAALPTPAPARLSFHPPETSASAGVHIHAGDVVGLVLNDPRAAAHLVDVLGFRTPAAPGTVALDGHDLADLPPEVGRALVFAAQHDAAIFTASVRDNLLLPVGAEITGRPVVDTLDPRALATSGVDEVLTHLPDAAASPLTAQGRNLSGGQRQRVLLGRALHRPEPVLVLHDPTTAVDTMTEAAIAAGLGSFPEKALILVTTSPTLLAACDRVVLMTGTDHVTGTHQELCADPVYRELVTP